MTPSVSKWAPSERVLRSKASHIEYEIATMIAQADSLRQLYPDGVNDAVGNALLEAILVHLRLLHEFFSPAREWPDGVYARHWLPSWKPKRVLTKTQLTRVNAQLTHLAARRRWSHGWPIQAMVDRCCFVALVFLDELEAAHPTRARRFSATKDLVAAR